MTGRAGRARLQAMVALLAALAATGAVGQPAPPAAPPAAAADVMAVLETVEARVAAAALGALATRDSSGFDAIESDLARLPERPATLAHWRAYWRGYAGYEGSIAALRAGDMATARRRLAGAIAALRQIRTPDVESDTLLAAVRGLELAFLPGRLEHACRLWWPPRGRCLAGPGTGPAGRPAHWHRPRLGP
jgi:hypothetical protein